MPDPEPDASWKPRLARLTGQLAAGGIVISALAIGFLAGFAWGLLFAGMFCLLLAGAITVWVMNHTP